MRLVITGGTATGKTTVAQMLSNQLELKQLTTHTTRDIRPGEPSSAYKWHKGEVPTDAFLLTEFRNNKYFTTYSDFAQADIAVLTRDAIPEVREVAPLAVVVRLYFQDVDKKIDRIYGRDPNIDRALLTHHILEYEGPDPCCDISICIDELTPDQLYEHLSYYLKENKYVQG